MEQARDALIKAEKQLVLKENELAEGKQQIQELEENWRNYEKAAREKVSLGRDIQLDEDQVCVCEGPFYRSVKSCVQYEAGANGQELLQNLIHI